MIAGLCSLNVRKWSQHGLTALPTDILNTFKLFASSSESGMPEAWDRYDAFKYMRGWTRDRFVACSFDPPPCPQLGVQAPSQGCSVGAPLRRLLLTADALASVHVEEVFRNMIEAAANARGNNTSRSREKRVLVVLDAAYAADQDGSQQATANDYCNLRTNEFGALGVSHVTCVLLDPIARAHEWEVGKNDTSRKAFGDMMHAIDDDYIFRELHSAVAVFAEMGDAIPLLVAMRRNLELHDKADNSTLSFGDALRARVLDGSGTLVYVGASGGSAVASEDLRFLGLEYSSMLGGNFSGLNLVPNCSFLAHATADWGPWVDSVARDGHSGMMGIPNCNPVVDWGSGARRLHQFCP